MGTCCCHQRTKFEVDFGPDQAEDEGILLRQMNQLPTYENMLSAFECLGGNGAALEALLPHRKERMFCMIVSLLRLRPAQAFAEQLGAFRARCDLRRGLFAPADVDEAVEALAAARPTHALELNGDLVASCREPEKLSRRMQANGFKAVKDLTVDFACREDLAITSLREFLEVFVQSVKGDQAFH